MPWPAEEAQPAAELESRQRDALTFHRLVQQRVLGIPDEVIASHANTPILSKWWGEFVNHAPDLRGWTLRPEHLISAPVGPYRITAKYDLLALRDGEAIIYDWKTYQRRPTNEHLAARWQTRVYLALLAHVAPSLGGGVRLEAERLRLIYWFAEFPEQTAEFGYDSRRAAIDWEEIRALTLTIAGESTWNATSDVRLCRFCVYRSFCNRGGAASMAESADLSEPERMLQSPLSVFEDSDM
jgi:hypothetical protein